MHHSTLLHAQQPGVRPFHSPQQLEVACTPRTAAEHSGARHIVRTVAPVLMCRPCVTRYIDMTFPLADACETCRAESPSGQPFLFGSLKEFQRAKLACKYATPGCKKRSCSPAHGMGGTPPRPERPRRRISPSSFKTGELRDQRALAGRAVRRPAPQRPAAAAAAVAGDVGQSLNPESLMKLDLAWASHVTTPPQIADGRSSFGPSVADAKASCAAR